MKKTTWIIGFMIFILVLTTGCSVNETGKSTDNSEKATSSEQQKEEKKPQDQNNEVAQDTTKKEVGEDKNLTELDGIFYGTEGEHPDLLILDSTYNQKNLTLSDEARVFFSDKVMNTLVKVGIREDKDKVMIESAKLIDSVTLKGKYIGFSDGNYAEFHVGEKGFVVEVPQEMIEKLRATKANELIEITIKQNETKQANPILVDFK